MFVNIVFPDSEVSALIGFKRLRISDGRVVCVLDNKVLPSAFEIDSPWWVARHSAILAFLSSLYAILIAAYSIARRRFCTIGVGVSRMTSP